MLFARPPHKLGSRALPTSCIRKSRGCQDLHQPADGRCKDESRGMRIHKYGKAGVLQKKDHDECDNRKGSAVAVTHDLKRPFTIPSPAQAIGEICKAVEMEGACQIGREGKNQGGSNRGFERQHGDSVRAQSKNSSYQGEPEQALFRRILPFARHGKPGKGPDGKTQAERSHSTAPFNARGRPATSRMTFWAISAIS